MASINVMAAITQDRARLYYQKLSQDSELQLQIVTTINDMMASIADQDNHVDVCVLDNALRGALDAVNQIRQNYPRLLIVLVDEEADFGLPGQADEMSTDPFEDDELIRKIKRLMMDRRMETRRSDSLPAMRTISRFMKNAVGTLGKQEATVQAVAEMGYDYVAYYSIESTEPLNLRLIAQHGPKTITSIAPQQADHGDLMGWVAQNGQSRIAAPEDKPNHPLVARGRLGAVACVPVAFSGHSFGVIVACQDRPNSIAQESVLMLDLVATQLATVLLKDQR